MVNLVRSRPNHYEVLGLRPASSSEDINRAFVSKMSLFRAHSMDEAAQFLIAYETLRDPAKRRDYDASIGLLAKEDRRQWSVAVTPPRWTAFMVPAKTNQRAPDTGNAKRPPEPQVTGNGLRQATAEPAQMSSGAMSTLAQNKSAAREAPPKKPAPQRQGQSTRDHDLDAILQQIRSVGHAEKDRLNRGNKSSDWRRVTMALGGLILCAGFVGALAGLSVKDNVSPAQAEPAAPTRHPLPRHNGEIVASSHAPVAAATEDQLDPPIHALLPKFSMRRAASRQRPRWSDKMAESLSAESPPASDSAVESPATQPAAEPQPTEAVAADLPLSTRLIAHTIERIGYPCGRVSSTAPIEGKEQGIYKITCSSGHTYQATPAHGRYHFRRVGGR